MNNQTAYTQAGQVGVYTFWCRHFNMRTQAGQMGVYALRRRLFHVCTQTGQIGVYTIHCRHTHMCRQGRWGCKHFGAGILICALPSADRAGGGVNMCRQAGLVWA